MRVGEYTKAFHPKTMGVMHPCKIVKVKDKQVRVEFYTTDRKRYWIPSNHLQE